MKDLLYLKDEQIKEFIQLLYYAYRETFLDPREILSKKFFERYIVKHSLFITLFLKTFWKWEFFFKLSSFVIIFK